MLKANQAREVASYKSNNNIINQYVIDIGKQIDLECSRGYYSCTSVVDCSLQSQVIHVLDYVFGYKAYVLYPGLIRVTW